MKNTLLFFCLVTFIFCSCANINEAIVYPDNIDVLTEIPDFRNDENKLSASINESIDMAWSSLIYILSQKAFVVYIKWDSEKQRMLSFIDRTTFFLDSNQKVVEMPYQVIMTEIDEKTTFLSVICRWDVIINENYIKSNNDRFEDLKKCSLTEAYILINQVNTQATSDKRWSWKSRD